uniref:La-related protein CG11505-like n=1 Tax=Drosophila rhopaloa TaxID=1041015 RepID=A0A6P4F9R0_DRORH
MIMPTLCRRVHTRVSILAEELNQEKLMIPPLIWSSVAPAKGETHKIEAHLKVRHALKVHEGRYQCNQLHSPYHMLHVRDSKGAGAGAGEPTESGYQTIDELTPNSADDFFTRTWQEQQQQQQQLPHQTHKQHKSHLGYGNASLSGSQHWHPSAGGGGGGGIHRVYSATPPDFPPPRFNQQEHTVAPPEPPTILYNQTNPTASATATEASLLLTTAHHHAHHQQQLQQQAQHTLNAFQLPLPPRPNPGQNERYQTYAPHYVPPVVGSGTGGGAGGGVGGGGGELTTISTATSTKAMMVGGGGAGPAGSSAPIMGAGGHMLMGGQVHLQHQTLLPVKMGEPHTHT